MLRNRSLWLAAGTFLGWCALHIWRCSFVAGDGRRHYTLLDDAMVSMRYAWRFAHGDGLTWNPGERVEGYTNLLQTLALGGVAWASDDRVTALLGARLFGVVTLLGLGLAGACLATAVLDRGRFSRAAAQTIGFLCGIAYYPLAAFALEGMETGLYTLCLVGAVTVVARGDALDARRAAGLGALLGGLALTRPEGVAPALLLLAALRWRDGLDGPPGRNLDVLLFVAVIVGLTLFRLAYYGEWLPNTYTLKVEGHPLALRIHSGLAHTLPFLRLSAPLYGLAILGAWLRRDLLGTLLLALALFPLAYQVLAGGDIFGGLGNYWRFPAPGIPFAALLSVDAVGRLAGRWRTPTVALVGLLPLAWANHTAAPEILWGARLPIGDAQSLTETALRLERILAADAVVAVAHAGTVPYYTGRHAIDLLGKSDRHVARLPPRIPRTGVYLPGHTKSDLAHSLVVRRPDWTETVRSGGEDVRALPGARFLFTPWTFEGEIFWLRSDSDRVRWDWLAPVR
jgi:hypothetical protein